MKNDIEEIILLTLILHRRHRKKRNYCATHSKPQFWMQEIFTRREQHGEFHQCNSWSLLIMNPFFGNSISSSSARISFISILYYYTINIFQKVNYKFLFFLIKDTLKGFDDFKNKQKSVWSNVFWYVKIWPTLVQMLFIISRTHWK